MSNPVKLVDLVALIRVVIGIDADHTSRRNQIERSQTIGRILHYEEGKE